MPINYYIEAICDGCGAAIEPHQPVKVTEIGPTRWNWNRKWKKEGVMKGLPSRYGKYRLFCTKCADPK